MWSFVEKNIFHSNNASSMCCLERPWEIQQKTMAVLGLCMIWLFYWFSTFTCIVNFIYLAITMKWRKPFVSGNQQGICSSSGINKISVCFCFFACLLCEPLSSMTLVLSHKWPHTFLSSLLMGLPPRYKASSQDIIYNKQCSMFTMNISAYNLPALRYIKNLALPASVTACTLNSLSN